VPRAIDYEACKAPLIQQRLREADRLTSALLAGLAGPAAEQRGYRLFQRKLPAISGVDLVSLDRLWSVFIPLGRFGFFGGRHALLRSRSAGAGPLLWPKAGLKNRRRLDPLSLRVHLVAAGA